MAEEGAKLTFDMVERAVKLMNDQPSKIYCAKDVYDAAVREFDLIKQHEANRKQKENYAKNWMSSFLRRV